VALFSSAFGKAETNMLIWIGQTEYISVSGQLRVGDLKLSRWGTTKRNLTKSVERQYLFYLNPNFKFERLVERGHYLHNVASTAAY
jgi:hypothetical protein